MPAVPEGIAEHAAILRSDARVLAECAERLREIEARLEAAGVAPPWLRTSMEAHLAACAAASDDLTQAAATLRHYAERTRP
ncbi:hypothetical protein AB0395_34170 [Streptosporangium sp. NPDC051023]|uniref:hypothetical protein n=1 Tax=Streptosporangium sp. NPDC051023 TaxID=3155410 RepID=UPI00344E71B0